MTPAMLKDMAFNDLRSLQEYALENNLILFYITEDKVLVVKGERRCVILDECKSKETLHLKYGNNMRVILYSDDDTETGFMSHSLIVKSVEVANYAGDKVNFKLETSPVISTGFILN